MFIGSLIFLFDVLVLQAFLNINCTNIILEQDASQWPNYVTACQHFESVQMDVVHVHGQQHFQSKG